MGLADSEVTVKMKADNAAYLKAVAQNERADQRAAEKRDAAIVASLKQQGKLTEEAFRTARAQAQVGTNAGKAVDFVGGKLKEFGKGLIGGAIGGVFAGAFGGGIGSIIQKLFEPPTPAEQRAVLTFVSRAGDAFEAFGFSAAKAAEALRELDRAETALMEKDARHEAFTRVGGLVEKYSGDTRALRFSQALDDIRGKPGAPGASTVLEAAEQARAIVDAMGAAGITLKSKDIYGIANELKVGLDVANEVYDQISVKQTVAKEKVKRARAAGTAVDKELLEWFKDQVAPTDTSAGRALLDARARQDRLIEDDRASRQAQLAQDFAAAEAQRQAAAAAAFGSGLGAYKARSPLEKIFGTAQEMQALGDAFAGFADAAGAGFEAIVTGSEGAGKAFAKFLSGSLLGIGKKAAVQAIYEVALAIAEPWDAGRHLLAAAKFGATAVAAGVAAAAIGGGGGGVGASAGGGAAPTGNYNSGFSGGQGGPSGTVFVYGDSFADDSPRMRQQKAERLLRMAQRSGPTVGGPDDVSYS